MEPEPSAERDVLAQSLREALEEDRFFGLESRTGTRAAPLEPPRPSTTSLFESVRSEGPKLPRDERIRSLAALAEEVRACRKCRLCETRTNTVPGEGDPEPKLVFVGEGPGRTEDETGRPFVGRAGKLLTDMIERGMGLRREQVFIANIVKCRPPENREPAPDEVLACLPYLRRQLDILDPPLVVALGRPAASALLETGEAIGRLRGRIHRKGGQKFVPTFHPAYLLRNPGEKPKAWDDLKLAMTELGIPIPRQGSSA